MSQTQVQLLGNVVTGAIITGIVTASEIKIGDSIGINTSGIITATGFVGNLTGDATGLSGTPNINAGVITATSFSGDGSGLTGVGIGSEGSINTTGIITASKISADEFVGTGDKLIFSPTITSFSPIQGQTDVSFDTNISLTFDQKIYAGVGTITLRNSSGIGTIIESIGIGSTSQITIDDQTLTINPTGLLPSLTDVYVVLPQGVIKNSLGASNAELDTYNFTTIDFSLISLNPTNGATNVGIDTNITISFTSTPTRGTGTIELKSGSVDGPIVESFDAATSPRISISGGDWILDPTNNLGFSTSFHLIIPSTAINAYVGLNTTGASSHSFTTRSEVLGDIYEGGYYICQSGGTKWIVSNVGSSGNWYSRGTAITCAQSASGCTGWFIPTSSQLQNPGYVCRTYWGGDFLGDFWSNTESTSNCAFIVRFSYGATAYAGPARVCDKNHQRGHRAFRCVTY